MAFYTNYVDDPFTDGAAIAVGDRMNVYIRRIADEIISVSAGEWLEVTSGAPTPTALRTYASTIATDVDNGDTATNGTHVTLYHATDPLIGSEDSRLIRLKITTNTQVYWFGCEFMDTAANEVWSYAPSASVSTGLLSENYGGYTTLSGTAGVFYPQRVYVFGDDEWMAFSIYDTVNARSQGAMTFLVPTTITAFARGQNPYFFALAHFSGGTAQGGTLRACDGSAYPDLDQTLHLHSGILDTQAELTLSQSSKVPLVGFSCFNKSGTFGYIMDLPRHYATRRDLVPDYAEFTADSRSFVTLGKLSSSYELTLAMDITPDPT